MHHREGAAMMATSPSTDDAVIFFFGQGQPLGHPEGPLELSVPRTELASVLA